jgi:tungstate transport system substrate-binding protein
MATTTSVVNSGLLSVLLPRFDKETGIAVRVHAAGSGRALEMLNDEIIDLVISHAPQAEAQMLAAHPDWRYRKIATNEFVIVGPPNDPAGIRTTADAPAAFERIANARARFLSRGDESGTHEREKDLWRLAGIEPDHAWLLVSGSGMAATLRQAAAQGAYTLTDVATFKQLQDRLALGVLVEGDARLVNSYAVVYAPQSAVAARFADWLAMGNGRKALIAYRIQDVAPFRAWPDGCPGDRPAAAPCE